MNETQLVNGGLERSRLILQRLENLFGFKSQGPRELIEAGVSRRRVRILYPFSVTQWYPAVKELTSLTGFSHRLATSVRELHPTRLVIIAPEDVRRAAAAHFDEANPYEQGTFVQGDLLALSAYMSCFAGYDPAGELEVAQGQTAAFGFWDGEARWSDLASQLTKIEAVLDELEQVRPCACCV